MNKSSCDVTFYKYHYGHQESELQHISLPISKKHEIAAKLSQGVTMERILDDFRGNIGSNLKREDLITRADLHNIKQNTISPCKMVNYTKMMPQVLIFG